MAITAAVGGGNWSAGATWVGGIAPTAADDVLLTAASGNVTVDAVGNACRSINCTGYTGTLTFGAGFNLAIGDASGGAALFVAGMTVTLSGGTLSFVSTSNNGGAGWNVTSGGKTLPATTFDGVGGKWVLQDNFSCGATALVVTNGSFFGNGKSITASALSSNNANIRTIDVTNCTITVTSSGTAWNFGTETNLTFVGTGSAISATGGPNTLNMGSRTYNSLTITVSVAALAWSGAATLATLIFTGSAAKTNTIQFQNNITVTTQLTLNGNSAINRLLVSSSTLGTARTFTIAGATLTSDNADYMDITLSVAKDLSAGSVGDCGGNTNITFTPAVTQTATGTASFTWSTHGWTTRVPLPQDNVLIPNAFVAGRTVTADMPRLGKSISFAGCTGSPIFANTVAQFIFGSLTLVTGVTPSGTSRLTLSGRAICTITSAGAIFTQGITVNAPGGTYTLQDAFSCNRTGSATFTITLGTFSDGGNTFALTDTTNTGFTMGGGTLNKTGIWSFSNTSASAFFTNTGGVVNDTGGAIILATASVNTRTFVGGGQTYFVLTYTVAGSTGQLTVTGDNTFDTINFSDPTNARILSLPTATSTTVRRFNVFGTSGKNMTVNGDVDSTSLQRIPDFLTIASSDATGGPWYAGANSTDGGSNTGWIFASAPPPDRPGLGSPISSMWNNRRVRSRLNRNERPNKTTITQPTHRQYHQAA